MLIHDRFVFLHVPKTGGRFVRRVLTETLPGCRNVIGPHAGWAKIPEEAAGRPVLAFVRNPWDWYVSWYTFMAGRPHDSSERSLSTEHPLIRALFAGGDNRGARAQDAVETGHVSDFATTLRRACGGVLDGGERPELERLVRGHKLSEALLAGDDFYTARFKATVGAGLDSELLTVGRFESLGEDLESFVRNAGIDAGDRLTTAIAETAPVGTGRRGSYRDYYDRELRDLVGVSCAWLIERFGYSFDEDRTTSEIA